MSDRGASPFRGIMGIVNATPDSFSDGGETLAPEKAAEKAMRLVAEGAAIIDLGGESTKPGAAEVSEEEEARRLLPALKAIRGVVDVPISIDTRRASVAARSLELGADIINDVSSLGDPDMARVVAESGAWLVLMHGYGEHVAGRGIVRDAAGRIVADGHIGIGDVVRYLEERIAFAEAAGIERGKMSVDPGLGFGKTNEESAEILRGVAELKRLGLPIVVGASRKRFLADLAEARGAKNRDEASRIAAEMAIARGADVVRVHEVCGMKF